MNTSLDDGLGIAIIHWANNVVRVVLGFHPSLILLFLVLAALDVDSATEGAGDVVVGAAEDLSPEEVLAFGASKVRQHVTRVQLFLDLTAALLGPDIDT